MTMTQDQETANGLISAMKLNQKALLSELRSGAHEARKAGDNEKAKALTNQAIALSRQNLVIHRAKQKALRQTDLGAINAELMAVVTEANNINAELEGVVDLLKKAAKFISLLRRMIDVFT